jgi:hypothetical protein
VLHHTAAAGAASFDPINVDEEEEPEEELAEEQGEAADSKKRRRRKEGADHPTIGSVAAEGDVRSTVCYCERCSQYIEEKGKPVLFSMMAAC